MERLLIVNADDFGLTEPLNKGIIHAHQNGILTSATLIPAAPAADHAIALSSSISTLGVGIHLNLTEGSPVSTDRSVLSLTDQNRCFSRSAAVLAALSAIDPRVRLAIETELAAQIQWVLDRGLTPTHLDSHKHVHSFPTIFSIVCKLARRFAIKAIRNTYEPAAVSRIPWPLTDKDGRTRARKLRAMARVNRFQNKDFFKTDVLLGVAHTGKINTAFIKAIALYNRAPCSELMTHPGYAEDLDPQQTRLVKQREFELETLCDEPIKQVLKDANIRLVHYGQL